MTRHSTPATRATPDALAAIDATVDGLCACGCGRRLDPAGPSGWFADAGCQWRYLQRHATDPTDVYRRSDAAAYPRFDSAQVPLTAGPRSPAELAAVMASIEGGFLAVGPSLEDFAAALRGSLAALAELAEVPLVGLTRGPAADRVFLDDPPSEVRARMEWVADDTFTVPVSGVLHEGGV